MEYADYSDSESAISQAKSTTTVSMSSVTVFQDLQDFVGKVTTACANVGDDDGQRELHIVKFLGKVRDRTWADIKAVFSRLVTLSSGTSQELTITLSVLTTAAEKIGWPMSINYAATTSSDRKALEDAFVNLLKLQTMCVFLGSHWAEWKFKYCRGKTIGAENGSNRAEKNGVYPIQALVVPVSLRFKYHFEGTRQTNRLDKVSLYSLVKHSILLTFCSSLSGISLTSSMSHMSIVNSWRQ